MKTKKERFEEVAGRRVNNVLKALYSLQKCSNQMNYDYNEQQVTKMMKAIQAEVEATKTLFSKTKKTVDRFQF